MNDPRTHVYAALTGQRFVGTQSDLAMILLAQTILNIGNKAGDRPIVLPGPFTGAERSKTAKAQRVPPKEKERLTERLRTYSSIPD